MGDKPGAPGEELAGLRNHPLVRGGRLEQLGSGRKHSRRDFSFKTAAEQPFQNVVGGTLVSDLFFSHGNHLMFGRRTRRRTMADSIGLSVSDGGNAGDKLIFVANLFGGGSVPACAYFGVQGLSPKFVAVPLPGWQIGAVPRPYASLHRVLTCT